MSRVVQWLRHHSPNAGSPGSIPGQGTRSHMTQLKILHAATKTRHSQMEKTSLLDTDKTGKQKQKQPESLPIYGWANCHHFS